MLKSKTIITDKATLIVVECPKTYSLFHDDEWELIGRMPDITDEDAEGIVDDPERLFNPTNPYYADDIVYPNYLGEERFWSATESLHSLLQANEVYFENPLGAPPTREDLKGKPAEEHAEIRERMRKWHEAQSKVWDKERCFLFLKIE